MRDAFPMSKWAQLSKGLWSSIIGMTKPNWAPTEPWNRDAYYKDIQQFYSLQYVCKLFNSIFQDDRHLESVLCLREGLESQDLCGMFEWIQQHGSTVETIVASSGSPYIEAALAALHPCQCQTASPVLTAFYAGKDAELGLYTSYPLADSILLLLSPFTSLASCQLDQHKGRNGPRFSLGPLQELPSLTRLRLTKGNFDSLDTARHLTHLCIQGSNVTCYEDCACVTSLVELWLNNTGLAKFHRDGVCACSQLQVLECAQSYIQAGHSSQTMMCIQNDDITLIPVHISRLTCLTRLEFYYVNKTKEYNFGWLSQLPSLKHFATTLDVKRAVFPHQLSVLCRLTHLQMMNNVWGFFCFELDWAKLSKLQTLHMGHRFIFRSQLSNLTSLQHLSKVYIRLKEDISAETAMQLATLAHQMVKRCPQVDFTVSTYDSEAFDEDLQD